VKRFTIGFSEEEFEVLQGLLDGYMARYGEPITKGKLIKRLFFDGVKESPLLRKEMMVEG